MLALLLLLGLGALLLVVIPRKSQAASQGRDRMTSFMEEDYTCCDLSVARSQPRCEGVLRDVAGMARGGPRSEFTVAAGNALARCASAELIDFAGDPAAVRDPIAFLASKLRSRDAAAAQKAARLLLSDSALSREVARDVVSGTGPFCGEPRNAPATEPRCPGAPDLVAALDALLLDEKEPEEPRERAGALLAALGGDASAAVPALTRALDSPSPAVRRSSSATLAGMGLSAIGALPAMTRRAHREPVPGLREALLEDIGRLDPVAGCCYALFRPPDPMCDESLGAIARHDRTEAPDSDLPLSEVCPAALVLELAGNPAAIDHPMPFFDRALRAPDVRTRRRAALSVALIAGTLHGHARVGHSTVEALHEALRSGIPPLVLDAAEALRQTGDSSLEGGLAADPAFFLATLEEKTSDRRAAAAWVLGQVTPPATSAAPALRAALDGSDGALADSAYDALNRIAVGAGFERLGIKRDGRYELKPEVLEALLAASRNPAAAVPR